MQVSLAPRQRQRGPNAPFWPQKCPLVPARTAFVNMNPSKISFNTGALITAGIGAVIMPWRLLADSTSFIGWLVGYGAILAPVIGGWLCMALVVQPLDWVCSFLGCEMISTLGVKFARS